MTPMPPTFPSLTHWLAMSEEQREAVTRKYNEAMAQFGWDSLMMIAELYGYSPDQPGADA